FSATIRCVTSSPGRSGSSKVTTRPRTAVSSSSARTTTTSPGPMTGCIEPLATTEAEKPGSGTSTTAKTASAATYHSAVRARPRRSRCSQPARSVRSSAASSVCMTGSQGADPRGSAGLLGLPDEGDVLDGGAGLGARGGLDRDRVDRVVGGRADLPARCAGPAVAGRQLVERDVAVDRGAVPQDRHQGVGVEAARRRVAGVDVHADVGPGPAPEGDGDLAV